MNSKLSMDGVKTKEESQQSESTDELKIVKEVKGLRVLTGARKTMSAARGYRPESKMMNSKVIRRSELSKEIIVPVPKTLNRGLFQTSLLSKSTDTNMPETETKLPETKTVNSDQVAENKDSFQSTAERVPNRSLSFQTKENSPGYGRKFYNKRPLESREVPNIDSGKDWILSHKNVRTSDRREYISKSDENKEGLLDKETKHESESFSMVNNKMEPVTNINILMGNAISSNAGLFPMQNVESTKVEKNLKSPDVFQPSPNLPCQKKCTTDAAKNIRFTNTENLNPQAIHPEDNVRNLNPKAIEFCGKNKKTNQYPKRAIKRNTAPNVADQNMPRMVNVENFTTSASEMNEFHKILHTPRPSERLSNVFRLMPPICDSTYKNVLTVPNQSYQGNSQYRMIGTASRDMNVAENQTALIRPTFQEQQMRTCGSDYINANYGFSAGFASPSASLRQNNPNFTNLMHTTAASQKPSVTAVQSNSNSVNLAYSAEASKISNMVNNSDLYQDKFTGLKSPKRSRAMENFSQSEQSSPEIKIVAVSGYSETDLEKKDESKAEEAQTKLTQVLELLTDINTTFADGFECAGLEVSLPIFRSELQECILSVEKLRKTLSEYKDKETV